MNGGRCLLYRRHGAELLQPGGKGGWRSLPLTSLQWISPNDVQALFTMALACKAMPWLWCQPVRTSLIDLYLTEEKRINMSATEVE